MNVKITRINILSNLKFSINILLWYVFTVYSTIYSKKFLNMTHDAYVLTFASFLYPACLKYLIFWKSRIMKKKKEPDSDESDSGSNSLISLLRNKEYLSLGFFNVATILFTNLGICETSVSLTYMVKVSNKNHRKKQKSKTFL